MSKKNLFATALLSMASLSAMAGGLLTNTNQNAAYVRQMSQGAIIDITGLYFNPAGTAFLSNGWHLSLNSQSAFQQRNIETAYPFFQNNLDNPNSTHRFEGRAKAPIIPSFQLSYNKDKWSVNASFALVGGGGKCEFDKGLGSFETKFSNIPTQVVQGINSLAPGAGAYGPDSYKLRASMKGRSYYFGLQLGATYKFMDNLAGYVGLRGTYATCNYNGYVTDLELSNAAMGGINALPAIPAFGPYAGVPYSALLLNSLNVPGLQSTDLTLDADQTGFGVAPIIGVDYKINEHWNVAAKYEAPTVMKLTNSSQMSKFAEVQTMDPSNPLAKFADGKETREDIPGILTIGAQYSLNDNVRFMGTFNEYFDKSAKKTAYELASNSLKDIKGAGIDHNTHEIILGAEYDVCKLITISASWQNTNYGISDAGMNDLSFNLSNNMIGLGLRINATKRCSIDLGYMHTFYQDREVKSEVVLSPSLSLPKTDNYVRKNDVFGIGVNLNF